MSLFPATEPGFQPAGKPPAPAETPGVYRAVLAVVESVGVLVFALVATVVLLAIYLVAKWGWDAGKQSTIMVELPALIGVQAAVFVASALVMIGFRTRPPDPLERTGAAAAAVMGVIGAALAFGLSFLVGRVMEWIGVPVQEQEWVLTVVEDPVMLPKLVPLVVLVGPLSEEVFFRGYVFRFLSEKVSTRWGYAVSSLMFAVIHFNWSGLAVYLVLGLVFAFVYDRSRNIVAPIVGHACFNALVLWLLVRGV